MIRASRPNTQVLAWESSSRVVSCNSDIRLLLTSINFLGVRSIHTVLIEHMLNHSSDLDLGFLGLPGWRNKAGFELFELLSGAPLGVLVSAIERFRASFAANAS